MTNAQKNGLIVGGLVGAGLTAAALALAWWHFHTTAAEEDGIRVKNGGSVVLETVSGAGFEYHAGPPKKFKTKKKTKGCAILMVVGGGCKEGAFLAVKATKVTLTVDIGGTQIDHVVFDNGEFSVDGDNWTPDGAASLKNGDADAYLLKVTAEKNNKTVLSCTAPSPKAMEALIYLCK